MRSSLFALVACFCLWILRLPAASASPDFRIEMEEDGWAFSSVQGNVEGELIDEESQAGERYLWSLESELGRVVGEVVIPRVISVLPGQG